MADAPALVLFELEHHGHHPHYVRHLVAAWIGRGIDRPLALVVTPAFARAHPEVLAAGQAATSGRVRVTLLTEVEATTLATARPLTAVSLQAFAQGNPIDGSRPEVYWSLVERYAAALRPAHALLMHLDACLLPMAMGRPVETPFSGILFRPSFHYPARASGRGAHATSLHGVHERFLMARALRHPMLRTVFCLDPTIVAPLTADGRVHAIPLADPLPYPPPASDRSLRTAAARATLGVEPGRRALLLFGQIAARKGWRQTLEALQGLPAELAARACLLVVGQVNQDERGPVRAGLDRLRAGTLVQVVERLGYVPDSLVPTCFDAADVVLAAYQRHVGMSGVLLLAAAHGKPVLTQGFGLMGSLTREHGLGLTVDTTDAEAIAQAVHTCLTTAAGALGDGPGMRALAERHTAAAFAATLLDAVL